MYIDNIDDQSEGCQSRISVCKCHCTKNKINVPLTIRMIYIRIENTRVLVAVTRHHLSFENQDSGYLQCTRAKNCGNIKVCIYKLKSLIIKLL